MIIFIHHTHNWNVYTWKTDRGFYIANLSA
jgi:hypothetical protein